MRDLENRRITRMSPRRSYGLRIAMAAAIAMLMAGCASSSDAGPTEPTSKVDADTTAPTSKADADTTAPSRPPLLYLRGDVPVEVAIYADGWVIWPIGDGDPGYLQLRLTPEAVERLRSRAVSTGLFEHDPTEWKLPSSWYVRPEISPFVPSRIRVVYDGGVEPDWATLPSPAREIVGNPLEGLHRSDGCQVISTDQAREIARALTQAGIGANYDSQRGLLGFRAARSLVHSFPALPHEVAC